MTKFIPERSVSLADAEQAIDHYFSDNSITVSFEKFGDPLSSTVATLDFLQPTSNDNVGCGKGYADEARVGAKFEAYEHYMGPQALRSATQLVDYKAIESQSALLNIFPLKLFSRKPTKMAAILFDDIHAVNGGGLLYPAFLIDYRYSRRVISGDDADYYSAKRYACGTGLASGIGFTEAAIHAVSEVIERHAIGRFISRQFFYKINEPIRLVVRETVCRELAGVLSDAEAVIGAEIQLFCVESEIDCPVFIAYCRDKTIAGAHIIGGGCSRYASHAAARAIKELVQQHKVADGIPGVASEWDRYRLHLNRYPRLLRCMQMKIDWQDPEKLLTIDMPQDPKIVPLDQHFGGLQNICKEAGFPVWLKTLHTSDRGISLVCAAMPNMERFSIVSLGGHVVPCHQYIDREINLNE